MMSSLKTARGLSAGAPPAPAAFAAPAALAASAVLGVSAPGGRAPQVTATVQAVNMPVEAEAAGRETSAAPSAGAPVAAVRNIAAAEGAAASAVRHVAAAAVAARAAAAARLPLHRQDTRPPSELLSPLLTSEADIQPVSFTSTAAVATETAAGAPTEAAAEAGGEAPAAAGRASTRTDAERQRTVAAAVQLALPLGRRGGDTFAAGSEAAATVFSTSVRRSSSACNCVSCVASCSWLPVYARPPVVGAFLVALPAASHTFSSKGDAAAAVASSLLSAGGRGVAAAAAAMWCAATACVAAAAEKGRRGAFPLLSCVRSRSFLQTSGDSSSTCSTRMMRGIYDSSNEPGHRSRSSSLTKTDFDTKRRSRSGSEEETRGEAATASADSTRIQQQQPPARRGGRASGDRTANSQLMRNSRTRNKKSLRIVACTPHSVEGFRADYGVCVEEMRLPASWGGCCCCCFCHNAAGVKGGSEGVLFLGCGDGFVRALAVRDLHTLASIPLSSSPLTRHPSLSSSSVSSSCSLPSKSSEGEGAAGSVPAAAAGDVHAFSGGAALLREALLPQTTAAAAGGGARLWGLRRCLSSAAARFSASPLPRSLRTACLFSPVFASQAQQGISNATSGPTTRLLAGGSSSSGSRGRRMRPCVLLCPLNNSLIAGDENGDVRAYFLETEQLAVVYHVPSSILLYMQQRRTAAVAQQRFGSAAASCCCGKSGSVPGCWCMHLSSNAAVAGTSRGASCCYNCSIPCLHSSVSDSCVALCSSLVSTSLHASSKALASASSKKTPAASCCLCSTSCSRCATGFASDSSFPSACAPASSSSATVSFAAALQLSPQQRLSVASAGSSNSSSTQPPIVAAVPLDCCQSRRASFPLACAVDSSRLGTKASAADGAGGIGTAAVAAVSNECCSSGPRSETRLKDQPPLELQETPFAVSAASFFEGKRWLIVAYEPRAPQSEEQQQQQEQKKLWGWRHVREQQVRPSATSILLPKTSSTSLSEAILPSDPSDRRTVERQFVRAPASLCFDSAVVNSSSSCNSIPARSSSSRSNSTIARSCSSSNSTSVKSSGSSNNTTVRSSSTNSSGERSSSSSNSTCPRRSSSSDSSGARSRSNVFCTTTPQSTRCMERRAAGKDNSNCICTTASVSDVPGGNFSRCSSRTCSSNSSRRDETGVIRAAAEAREGAFVRPVLFFELESGRCIGALWGCRSRVKAISVCQFILSSEAATSLSKQHCERKHPSTSEDARSTGRLAANTAVQSMARTAASAPHNISAATVCAAATSGVTAGGGCCDITAGTRNNDRGGERGGRKHACRALCCVAITENELVVWTQKVSGDRPAAAGANAAAARGRLQQLQQQHTRTQTTAQHCPSFLCGLAGAPPLSALGAAPAADDAPHIAYSANATGEAALQDPTAAVAVSGNGLLEKVGAAAAAGSSGFAMDSAVSTGEAACSCCTTRGAMNQYHIPCSSKECAACCSYRESEVVYRQRKEREGIGYCHLLKDAIKEEEEEQEEEGGGKKTTPCMQQQTRMQEGHQERHFSAPQPKEQQQQPVQQQQLVQQQHLQQQRQRLQQQQHFQQEESLQHTAHYTNRREGETSDAVCVSPQQREGVETERHEEEKLFQQLTLGKATGSSSSSDTCGSEKFDSPHRPARNTSTNPACVGSGAPGAADRCCASRSGAAAAAAVNENGGPHLTAGVAGPEGSAPHAPRLSALAAAFAIVAGGSGSIPAIDDSAAGAAAAVAAVHGSAAAGVPHGCAAAPHGSAVATVYKDDEAVEGGVVAGVPWLLVARQPWNVFIRQSYMQQLTAASSAGRHPTAATDETTVAAEVAATHQTAADLVCTAACGGMEFPHAAQRPYPAAAAGSRRACGRQAELQQWNAVSGAIVPGHGETHVIVAVEYQTGGRSSTSAAGCNSSSQSSCCLVVLKIRRKRKDARYIGGKSRLTGGGNGSVISEEQSEMEEIGSDLQKGDPGTPLAGEHLDIQLLRLLVPRSLPHHSTASVTRYTHPCSGVASSIWYDRESRAVVMGAADGTVRLGFDLLSPPLVVSKRLTEMSAATADSAGADSG